MNTLRYYLLSTVTAPKTVASRKTIWIKRDKLIKKLNSTTDSEKPLERQGKDPTSHICISHLGKVSHYIHIGRNPETAGRNDALNLKKKKSERQKTVSILNKGREKSQHCPAEDWGQGIKFPT